MAAELVEIENRLWAAADQLWANTGLRPADFSDPVLGMIFPRYADKRFEEAHKTLFGKGFKTDELEATDYQAEGVVHLPDSTRSAPLAEWVTKG